MPLTPAAVIAEIDGNRARLGEIWEDCLLPANIAVYVFAHANEALTLHQQGDRAGYRELLLDLATMLLIELERSR